MEKEPKYGFSGRCPEGHQMLSAFERDDVQRDIVSAPENLQLLCPQCGKSYPLTPEMIARAKADLGIK